MKKLMLDHELFVGCITDQWQVICFYKPAISSCVSNKLLWTNVAREVDTLSDLSL